MTIADEQARMLRRKKSQRVRELYARSYVLLGDNHGRRYRMWISWLVRQVKTERLLLLEGQKAHYQVPNRHLRFHWFYMPRRSWIAWYRT